MGKCSQYGAIIPRAAVSRRRCADLATGFELFDQAVRMYGEEDYTACLSAIQQIVDDLQAEQSPLPIGGRPIEQPSH